MKRNIDEIDKEANEKDTPPNKKRQKTVLKDTNESLGQLSFLLPQNQENNNESSSFNYKEQENLKNWFIALPDRILSMIFSFLEFKECAANALISRRIGRLVFVQRLAVTTFAPPLQRIRSHFYELARTYTNPQNIQRLDLPFFPSVNKENVFKNIILKFPQLESVQLEHSNSITSRKRSSLPSSSSSSSPNSSSSSFNNSIFSSLSLLDSLRYLSINSARISDSGISAFETSIESLPIEKFCLLNNSKVTRDSLLKLFDKFPSLKKIEVPNIQLKTEDLENFPLLKNAEFSLHKQTEGILSNTNIQEAKIYLENVNVTFSFPFIKSLHLNGSGSQFWTKIDCPQITNLRIQNFALLSPNLFQSQLKTPNLIYLNLDQVQFPLEKLNIQSNSLQSLIFRSDSDSPLNSLSIDCPNLNDCYISTASHMDINAPKLNSATIGYGSLYQTSSVISTFKISSQELSSISIPNVSLDNITLNLPKLGHLHLTIDPSTISSSSTSKSLYESFETIFHQITSLSIAVVTIAHANDVTALTSFIEQFPHLYSFSLYHVSHGSPPFPKNLKHLQSLNLVHAHAFQIPTQKLKDIRVLDLDSKSDAPFSLDAFNLPKLRSLSLTAHTFNEKHNSFLQLGNCTELRYLRLTNIKIDRVIINSDHISTLILQDTGILHTKLRLLLSKVSNSLQELYIHEGHRSGYNRVILENMPRLQRAWIYLQETEHISFGYGMPFLEKATISLATNSSSLIHIYNRYISNLSIEAIDCQQLIVQCPKTKHFRFRCTKRIQLPQISVHPHCKMEIVEGTSPWLKEKSPSYHL
eukprot:gb/GECH01009321.1/.p1 GENE.gb/GECH01009321.1/~~gb/GECH01009321.1/.p1  ORF type:complete len:811 (+),score=186.51 gb/GECH01009321.1/:1-2433(+)